MIAAELRQQVVATVPEQQISDVRIGLGYTAVMLQDGSVGVAYTFHQDAEAGCCVFTGRRPIAGRTSTEMLEYLGSDSGVESTVGLAVANALTNRSDIERHEGDILEVLPVDPQDRVGMVGYFGPLVGPLDRKVRELLIFERNPGRSARVLPAEEAMRLLPKCDIAIITSTALIVGELDRLLDASAGCREVALVGASTSLTPEVFRPYGVTLLSGITVVDGPGILQVVSEGGGMGYFGKRIRKVNIRLR